jgi:hypothetical protein
VLRVFWPGATIIFEPSGTLHPGVNERSRTHRAPFTKRFVSSGTLIHLIYVICASVVLLLRARDWFVSGRSFPFPGAILRLAEWIVMMSIPLWYLAFPPTVPERADLLVKAEDGLMRPRKKSGETESTWSVIASILWDALVVSLCAS